MTTQAPTNNPASQSAPTVGSDWPDLPSRAGLDEARLNQLANAFFAVLPSAAPVLLNAATADARQQNSTAQSAATALVDVSPAALPSLAPATQHPTQHISALNPTALTSYLQLDRLAA